MGNLNSKLKRIFTGGAGNSGSSSASTAATFRRTFTTAEMKTLFSIPITIIAAPGINKMIVIDPNSIGLRVQTGAVNMNYTGGGDIVLEIGATGTYPWQQNGNTLATDYETTGGLVAPNISTGFDLENLGIILKHTTGDSATGTVILTMIFNYHIHDFS